MEVADDEAVVEIGVVFPGDGIPLSLHRSHIASLLSGSGAQIQDGGGTVAATVQAPYEEQEWELRYRISFAQSFNQEEIHKQFEDLVMEWCCLTAGGLHSCRRLIVRDRNFYPINPEPMHMGLNVVGISVGAHLNPGLFVEHWSHRTRTQHSQLGTQYSIWANFMHYKRSLLVFLQPASNEGYKVEISYQSMHSLLVDTGLSEDGEEVQRLYFTLRWPPLFWKKLRSPDRRAPPSLNDPRDFVRVSSMPRQGLLKGILGSSSVFCLTLPQRDAQQYTGVYDPNRATSPLFPIIARLKAKARLNPFFARVGSFILFSQTNHPHEVVLKVKQLKADAIFGRNPEVRLPQLHHFPCNYALEALVSQGFIVTDQLKQRIGSEEPIFGAVVAESSVESPTATQRALDQLVSAIDERRSINILKAFHFLFRTYFQVEESGKKEEGAEEALEVPPGCCLVPKIVLTPTRRLLLAPQVLYTFASNWLYVWSVLCLKVMLCNRVIRKFGQEFALRLSFRDDDGRKIQNNMLGVGRGRDEGRDLLVRMVRRGLLEGVRVGGRHFRFLGWSNSQLRDHGCYLYADQIRGRRGGEEEKIGVEEMRRWMGDFTAIGSVPKLMSRMGQCFTQAQIADPDVPDSSWIVEQDLTGGAGHPETGEPYNFSDGIGRVSRVYANRLAEALQLDYLPSAFQIRFRGFKGMLTIDPWMDETDSDGRPLNIVFRKSMQKFSSDGSNALEVVKYAMPSPVCFNRPLIMIIDQVAEKQGSELSRRVHGRVVEILEQELAAMADMLISEREAATALDDRLSLPIAFRRLREQGMMLTGEPFARRLLLALHRYTVKEKLFKAKIDIHPSYGRTLYGVLDDTGLLQYGQVFIQVSKYLRPVGGSKRIISGQVLVTKNPCIVPGDVRVFEAVDLEPLRYLNDVIVFPRHGPRPHPDEMAGSDLDGDEYSVFWDQSLLFAHSEPAMTYPPSLSLPNIVGGANTSHMVGFFLDYLTQDSIGKISNAHLAAADRLGIFSDTCMEIGRKCSMAVDFPKTGVPADSLEKEEMTFKYPDYFLKDHNPCYRSSRLLGLICRKTKRVEEMLELGGFEHTVTVDPHLIHPHASKYRQDALRQLQRYGSVIQSLLDNYGIVDEASLVSGQMLTLRNRVTEMDKEDYSFYNTEKLVELRYSRLLTQTRRAFFAEFGGEPDEVEEVASDEMLAKVSAWYQAAYGGAAAGDSRLAFLSFPWTLWELLGLLKRKAVFQLHSEQAEEELFHSRLSRLIKAYCNERMGELGEFATSISKKSKVLMAYLTRYDFLAKLIFVLVRWAGRNAVFTRSMLREKHLGWLLVMFVTGMTKVGRNRAKEPRTEEAAALETREQGEDSWHRLEPVASLEEAQRLNAEDGLTKGMDLSDHHCLIFLRFLSYLASEAFRRQSHISFVPLGLPNKLVNGEWILLHQVAFQTYNGMALSGEPGLFLGSRGGGGGGGGSRRCWDVEEGEPVAIELAPNTGGLSDMETSELLREWSGTEVVRLVREQRSLEVVRVVGMGTLSARHKLRLIITSDTLPSALAARSPPTLPAY